MNRGDKIHAKKLRRLARRRKLYELHRAGLEERGWDPETGKRKRTAPDRLTTRPRK